MKKYNPLFSQFILESKDLLLVEDRNIDGYIPKTYCAIKNDKFVVSSNQQDFSHILKFSLEIPSGSDNEHFFLWLSKQCDITTSNAFLIKENFIIDDTSFDSYMLLSENFISSNQNIVHLKSLFKTDERKKGITLNRVYEVIDGFEAINKDKKENIKLELFKQVLFSNTIGNYDLNYGNIAFLTNENNEIVDLSPAYDITCTYVFDDSTKSSIVINGKRKDITALDILEISAKYLDAVSLISASKNISKGIKENIEEIENSYMEKEDISFIHEYVKERINLLSDSINNCIVSICKAINPTYKLLTIDEYNSKLFERIEDKKELENKYNKFLELELNSISNTSLDIDNDCEIDHSMKI